MKLAKFLSNLTYSFGRYLCRNRRRKLQATIGELVKGLYFSYENHNYHFSSNGELFLIKVLPKSTFKTIFDVGANIGAWTKSAVAHFDNAQFYCFEIIPETFEQLKSNLAHINEVEVFNFGFGELPKSTFANYHQLKSSLSSVYSIEIGGLDFSRIEVEIQTLDKFCFDSNISSIDFLKIDTEGMDFEVLLGASKLLGSGQIKVIQFEYGFKSIETGFLLKDFYNLLGDYGYRVGKLYPNYVAFRNYHRSMEDFIGPNFVAVHSNHPEIIRTLNS